LCSVSQLHCVCSSVCQSVLAALSVVVALAAMSGPLRVMFDCCWLGGLCVPCVAAICRAQGPGRGRHPARRCVGSSRLLVCSDLCLNCYSCCRAQRLTCNTVSTNEAAGLQAACVPVHWCYSGSSQTLSSKSHKGSKQSTQCQHALPRPSAHNRMRCLHSSAQQSMRRHQHFMTAAVLTLLRSPGFHPTGT
jgi:hypothetical protein